MELVLTSGGLVKDWLRIKLVGRLLVIDDGFLSVLIPAVFDFGPTRDGLVIEMLLSDVSPKEVIPRSEVDFVFTSDGSRVGAILPRDGDFRRTNDGAIEALRPSGYVERGIELSSASPLEITMVSPLASLDKSALAERVFELESFSSSRRGPSTTSSDSLPGLERELLSISSLQVSLPTLSVPFDKACNGSASFRFRS